MLTTMSLEDAAVEALYGIASQYPLFQLLARGNKRIGKSAVRHAYDVVYNDGYRLVMRRRGDGASMLYQGLCCCAYDFRTTSVPVEGNMWRDINERMQHDELVVFPDINGRFGAYVILS